MWWSKYWSRKGWIDIEPVPKRDCQGVPIPPGVLVKLGNSHAGQIGSINLPPNLAREVAAAINIYADQSEGGTHADGSK